MKFLNTCQSSQPNREENKFTNQCQSATTLLGHTAVFIHFPSLENRIGGQHVDIDVEARVPGSAKSTFNQGQ